MHAVSHDFKFDGSRYLWIPVNKAPFISVAYSLSLPPLSYLLFLSGWTGKFETTSLHLIVGVRSSTTLPKRHFYISTSPSALSWTW